MIIERNKPGNKKSNAKQNGFLFIFILKSFLSNLLIFSYQISSEACPCTSHSQPTILFSNSWFNDCPLNKLCGLILKWMAG